MPRTPAQKLVIRTLHVNLERDLSARYVDKRHSLRSIAEHYQVSAPTISRWLDELNIAKRPRGRPRKDGTIPSYAVDLA